MASDKPRNLLRVVSNSERSTFACQRKWSFRYLHGLTTDHSPTPLRMGSLWHLCLANLYGSLTGHLITDGLRIGFQAHKREEGHVHARWRARIERGDRGSLDGILRHNREDLEGTAALYRRLLVMGHIAPRFG